MKLHTPVRLFFPSLCWSRVTPQRVTHTRHEDAQPLSLYHTFVWCVSVCYFILFSNASFLLFLTCVSSFFLSLIHKYKILNIYYYYYYYYLFCYFLFADFNTSVFCLLLFLILDVLFLVVVLSLFLFFILLIIYKLSTTYSWLVKQPVVRAS